MLEIMTSEEIAEILKKVKLGTATIQEREAILSEMSLAVEKIDNIINSNAGVS
jgi:hypothetical protein